MSWNGSIQPTRDSQSVTAQRDLVITSLVVVTARRENFILWYNDRTNDLVTFKSMYLPNLSGFVQIKPFRTPETTWMLILAPAVRRFKRTSIKRNLRSITSFKSSGRPLTLPIVIVHLFLPSSSSAPVWIFCDLLTHGHTVLLVKFGKFDWNFLIADVTPQIAAYFAISCLSFST